MASAEYSDPGETYSYYEADYTSYSSYDYTPSSYTSSYDNKYKSNSTHSGKNTEGVPFMMAFGFFAIIGVTICCGSDGNKTKKVNQPNRIVTRERVENGTRITVHIPPDSSFPEGFTRDSIIPLEPPSLVGIVPVA